MRLNRVALIFATLGLGAVLSFRSEPHDQHISFGRMAVEDNVAVLRVRFFRHDLEETLAAFHHVSRVTMDLSAVSDSLFSDYSTSHLVLVVENDTIPHAIVTSGEDRDVWWYELQFIADRPIASFVLSNSMLVNQFEDQQNIFYVTHFPSERRQTLYFVRGESTHEVDFR